MKRIFILIMIFGSFFGCNPDKKNGELFGKLQLQKAAIDAKLSTNNLIVLARTSDGPNLILVKNKRYPKHIETTYNVLKDSLGKVIYVAEMPYSKSNDWFIAYKNYYDSTGRLFAFERVNNFLKSNCTPGAVMEKLIKYYTPRFVVLDSVYMLTDTKKQTLKKDNCLFPFNFPYHVYPDWQHYKQNSRLNYNEDGSN